MIRNGFLVAGISILAGVVLRADEPTVDPDFVDSARRTMDHDFTVCGCRYRFPGEIDWNFNPTSNAYREWPFQFARHYFLPNLARYYEVSGDENAARCFAEIVGGFIDRVPPPPPETPTDATKSWRTLDAGLRVTMWMHSYFSFTNSPSLTPEFRVKFRRSLDDHIRRLLPSRTKNNWRVMELRGLAELLFACPELDPGDAILREVEQDLVRQIGSQLYPDGFQFELTPGYHSIIPMDYGAIIRLYRQAGRTPPPAFEKGVELSFELYPHITRPDRCVPSVNDSGSGSIVPMMRRAIGLFPGREDFRWFATEGLQGRAPDYLSYAFPYSGGVVFRDSWSTNAVWAYVDMSPFGVSHQHEDKLNFLLFAYGREMLTEGGNYAYDTSETRRYVLSTRSHNTIRVDGGDQCTGETYAWKQEMLHQKADLRFEESASKEVATASYTNGYRRTDGGIDHSVIHTRTVEFLKGGASPRFRVTDRLCACDDREHSYEQLWHLETCDLAMDKASFRADFGGGVTLAASFVSENGVLEDQIGRKKPEYQGWKPIPPFGDHEQRPIHTPTLRGTFRREATIITDFVPSCVQSAPVKERE